MELIAHPFRLFPAGVVATVTEGTEADITQALAVLVATGKGERPLVPTFGVTDPTFDELDAAEMNAALAVFGPDVTVTRISRSFTSPTTETDAIEWEYTDADA